MTKLGKLHKAIFVFALFLILSYLSIVFILNVDKYTENILSNILAFTFGYVFADLWELVTCNYLNLDGGQELGNYHLHHSLFGASAILISCIAYFLFGQGIAAVLFFWGAGNIVQHTLSEKRFVFISKKK